MNYKKQDIDRAFMEAAAGPLGRKPVIYKKQDIDRIFTETVAGLLAQGYQINPTTMNGTQGEIAHIDLRKGDDLLRVLLEQEPLDWPTNGCLCLVVGRDTDHLRTDMDEHVRRRNRTFEPACTIWNYDLQILSEIKFYTFGYHSAIYAEIFCDKATAEEAAAKRTARALAWRKSNNARRGLPDGFKSAALHWVQKKKGFKRCRLDEIESVTRVNLNEDFTGEVYPELDHYEIKVRGRIFKLYPRKEA